jgi:aspartate ammonia-lyase
MKFTNQHQNYQSEITRFIADLKQKNPDLEQQQREGRALLWDKTPLDMDQQKRTSESSIKQQAYVYQTKS